MNNNGIFKFLNIKYKPLFSGTEKTKIRFIDSDPDLDFLLSDKKKLFITDTNVFALSSLKKFFSNFSKEKEFSQGRTTASIYTHKKNGTTFALIVIPAGEEFKTIDTVLAIIKCALEFSLTRKDVFTGLGGGVITDLTAFASSIYKRGALCEFVPTTLLAMVDAAIGGKTGCDFESYKNIAGTFYPAKTLDVFPSFVKSLNEKEFFSGFAEALKTALLFNKNLVEYIKCNKEKIISRNPECIYKIITECAKEKAKIVQKDLSEKNIRMLLNFGHTFGHALESNAGLGRLTHGECVAWGMMRAVKLSLLKGLCSPEYYKDVQSLLVSFGYETKAIHSAFSDSQKILQTMKNDKKNSSENIRVILQKGISKNIITEVTDTEILEALNND